MITTLEITDIVDKAFFREGRALMRADIGMNNIGIIGFSITYIGFIMKLDLVDFLLVEFSGWQNGIPKWQDPESK